MRVEILQELEPDDDKLEIPWASPTDPNLYYADLKVRPEQIDHLEECRNRPSLGEFLRKVNSSDSLFGTAKCGVWSTAELSEDERLDFALPFKVGSYVDLLFDRREFNSELEHQLRLGEKLSQALRTFRAQAQLEICVRRCLFHPEERWGYYLTLFTHAYGATPEEAEQEWSRALGALADALMRINQILHRVLAAQPNHPPSPSGLLQ